MSKDERSAHYRRYTLKARYGVTPEQYDAIIARGCAICGTQDGRICLDHDHTSGQVRDALCHACNTGIGRFADDPERVRAAVKYLETHLK